MRFVDGFSLTLSLEKFIIKYLYFQYNKIRMLHGVQKYIVCSRKAAKIKEEKLN